MVSVASLWAPILISAVLVFVISSIIHMLLGYHAGDFGKVSRQDAVLDALRGFNLAPGDYLLPRPASAADSRSPEFAATVAKGPVVMMTVMPGGGMAMGKSLGLWFAYTLVVGLFAGYVASLALAPGADYRQVFRITSTVAFAGYVLALWQNVIWYGRSGSTAGKSTFDGLIYALVTGGVFGWLWP
jgi:hypothetical protein